MHASSFGAEQIVPQLPLGEAPIILGILKCHNKHCSKNIIETLLISHTESGPIVGIHMLPYK